MITYRLVNGSWMAYGPTSEMRLGEITITKKDGTTKTDTVIERIGPYEVDGKSYSYGRLVPTCRKHHKYRMTQEAGKWICPKCKEKENA